METHTPHAERVLADALRVFSSGDVLRAQSILDTAAEAEATRAELRDLLALRCVRASIAAMGGERSVSALMADAAGAPLHRPLVLYLEGLAAMADGASLQTARVKFEESLRVDGHFVVAKIGLATVHYHMRRYKESFSHYREVMETLGSASPPVVRVGMALCAYRLGRLEYAQRWLERALAVDPDNELALLGLLVVYLDRRRIPRVIATVRRLQRAVPGNAMVLLKVADLAYFKAVSAGGSVRAAAAVIRRLLADARAVATPEEAALADFQAGRLALALGDLPAARARLEAAMQSAPHLLAARVHHARLLVLAGREADAAQLLRRLHAEHPSAKEVLQLLAVCAARGGEQERAIAFCRRLTESVAPGDARSWEIAAWCARLDTAEARRLMTHVARIRKELGEELPVQLRANIAALAGDTDALQGILDKELGADFLSQPELAVGFVPLVFNLALLLEERDRTRARQLYIFLVKQHGYFQLPYMRLHALAKADGMWQQAVAWLVLLQEVKPEEPHSLAAIGQIFFEQQRFMAAMSVLRVARGRSIPVALALGATFLWCSQQHGKDNRRFLVSAKDRFAFVLRRDKGNILAAHGLSCCLGLEADYDRCQSLLDRVGEVMPNCPYVRSHFEAHMANVKTLSDSFKQAIDYLAGDTQRTPLQTSTLAFCLACENRYEEAIAALSPVAAEQTEMPLLQYNLALVHCAAFVAAVSRSATLSIEKARELRHNLSKGLSMAFEFTQQEPKSQAMAVAKAFLKSVCAYCLDVNDRSLNRLILAGRRDAEEFEQQAVLWRRVYADLEAEKCSVTEQRAAEQQQRREQEEQVAREIFEDFHRSQLGQQVMLDPMDDATRAQLDARQTEFAMEAAEHEETQAEGEPQLLPSDFYSERIPDMAQKDFDGDAPSAAILSGMHLEDLNASGLATRHETPNEAEAEGVTKKEDDWRGA